MSWWTDSCCGFRYKRIGPVPDSPSPGVGATSRILRRGGYSIYISGSLLFPRVIGGAPPSTCTRSGMTNRTRGVHRDPRAVASCRVRHYLGKQLPRTSPKRTLQSATVPFLQDCVHETVPDATQGPPPLPPHEGAVTLPGVSCGYNLSATLLPVRSPLH